MDILVNFRLFAFDTDCLHRRTDVKLRCVTICDPGTSHQFACTGKKAEIVLGWRDDGPDRL
jgi:hypothetical protein